MGVARLPRGRLPDNSSRSGRITSAAGAGLISICTYYTWKKKYGDTNVDEARRLRRLEKENARLLRIVGQQRLEIDAMKDVIGKKR